VQAGFQQDRGRAARRRFIEAVEVFGFLIAFKGFYR